MSKVRCKVKGADRYVAQVTRALPDALQRSLTAELEGLVNDARGDWPVKTGRSRDGLQVVERDGGAAIVDTAPYVPDIAGDPWRTLVVEPAHQRAPQLAESVGEDLADVARRGG